jgi:hypothetical protein
LHPIPHDVARLDQSARAQLLSSLSSAPTTEVPSIPDVRLQDRPESPTPSTKRPSQQISGANMYVSSNEGNTNKRARHDPVPNRITRGSRRASTLRRGGKRLRMAVDTGAYAHTRLSFSSELIIDDALTSAPVASAPGGIGPSNPVTALPSDSP